MSRARLMLLALLFPPLLPLDVLPLQVLPLHALPAHALGQLPGPSVMLRDSIVLEESDDHYVSHPVGVVRGPGDTFLISDGNANSVLQFDSIGRFIRGFGARGRGPGEFMAVGGFYATSEVLGAADPLGMKLEFFDYTSGEPIGAVDIPRTLRMAGLSARGDSIWIFGMDRSSWMSIGTVAQEELIRIASQPGGGSGEALRLDRVTVPRPYQLNPRMFGNLGNTLADLGASNTVVGFGGTPYLLVVDGSRVDTLHLTPRDRREMPSEDEMSDREFYLEHRLSTSLLIALSRDPAGHILLVHRDDNVENADPSIGLRFLDSQYYVSSLSPDGTRQCADTRLPLSDVGFPWVSLSGSELMVVDQVASSATLVTTVIRRYEVDASTCDGTVR